MNHCLIQCVIKTIPQMRYTKDNQTAMAETTVIFKGLRNDDPSSDLKVVGWGSLAQEMVDELKEGTNLIIEGRLKMNSFTRKDGTKEKQPELTASKIHQIYKSPNNINVHDSEVDQVKNAEILDSEQKPTNSEESSQWNSSPLVPEVDEIPF